MSSGLKYIFFVVNDCREDLYLCKECPATLDEASFRCERIHIEQIPNCPEDKHINGNGFLTLNKTYYWLGIQVSQHCCWDVKMANGILREVTIKKSESLKWTVRYYKFGIHQICRSLGQKLPDNARKNVKSGNSDINPRNNQEICYPYDYFNGTFDDSYCGYPNGSNI